jgi:hypothetical protein
VARDKQVSGALVATNCHSYHLDVVQPISRGIPLDTPRVFWNRLEGEDSTLRADETGSQQTEEAHVCPNIEEHVASTQVLGERFLYWSLGRPSVVRAGPVESDAQVSCRAVLDANNAPIGD